MKNSQKILLILVLGFGLRVWGIGFGLPHLYHADEPIVVNHAVAYGTGDFHPHFFKIPPLISYLLFFAYGIYFLIGRLLGWFVGVTDFERLFLTDPTSFYLLARVLFGALTGTLTIFLLYRLLSRHFSETHALLSAFFLAVAFLHVRDSHYIYVDIPVLLVLMACFFPILKISEREKRRDYLIFGLLAGAAVATKYNGVFIFIPFLTAHLVRKKFRFSEMGDRNLIGAGLISLVAFVLLNPFSLLDWPFFSKELLIQGSAQGGVRFLHHLTYSLNGGLGIGLCFFGVGGLFFSFFRRERKRWILAAFVLFYYCPVLVFFSQSYERYALPLLPFLVFFASDLILELGRRMRLSGLVLLAMSLVIASPSLAKVALSNQIFLREDVRTIARMWIESHLASGAKIALDTPFFMPPLKPTHRQLEEKKEAAIKAGNRAQLKRIGFLLEGIRKKPEEKRYELYFLRNADSQERFLFARPSIPYDLNALRNQGIRYVIGMRLHEDQDREFYERLQAEARNIARFSPYRDSRIAYAIDPLPLTGGPFLWRELVARIRNGQIIEIYQLNGSS